MQESEEEQQYLQTRKRWLLRVAQRTVGGIFLGHGHGSHMVGRWEACHTHAQSMVHRAIDLLALVSYATVLVFLLKLRHLFIIPC